MEIPELIFKRCQALSSEAGDKGLGKIKKNGRRK